MVAHDTRSSFFGLSLECLNDKLNNIASPCLFFFFFLLKEEQRKDVVPMETFNGWQCLCFYKWINPLRWLIHPLIKGEIANNYFRSKSATNTSFIGSRYCSFLCCLMPWATWGFGYQEGHLQLQLVSWSGLWAKNKPFYSFWRLWHCVIT